MSGAAGSAVSGERLWADLMAMAEVGATPEGGSRRLALTDEDRAGRELFAGWARDAGLELRGDRAGNMFARLPGSDPERPAVMTGSHLDTQPNGGRFDGVFGVLAGLEAARALRDAGGANAAPLDVVVWTNEEGGRFPQFCTGSSVYAGVDRVEEIRELRAFDGPSYGDELDRVGFAGDEEPGSAPASAFIELHIEQGPVLEREGVPLGIVQGIRGIRRFAITLVGEDAHAGSPMEGRRDALRAAARVVEALAEVGENAGGATVTAGRIEVSPNAPSVVPGRARLVIDIRGAGLDSPDEVLARVRSVVAELFPGGDGISAEVDANVWTYGPFPFDTGLLDVLRGAADARGERWLDMVSPAGHDAGYVAAAGVPTAMLFVPCRDGLSHHPAEWAESKHLELACRVLADSLATLAS